MINNSFAEDRTTLNSGIKGSLSKWLKKALAPNPSARYSDAKVAKEALIKCLEPEPVMMPVEPSHTTIGKPAESSVMSGVTMIVGGSISAIAMPKLMAAIIEMPPVSPASPFNKTVDQLLSVGQPIMFLFGTLAMAQGFWRLVVALRRGEWL